MRAFFVKRWGQNLQAFEETAFAISAAWQGQAPRATVQYPRTFNVLFESDYLDRFEWTREVLGDLSSALILTQAMMTYRRLNPDAEPELVEMIEGEIEAALAANVQEQAFNKSLSGG